MQKQPTGEVVAAVPVADEAERAGSRRRLAALAAVDEPGLAPLRGIAETADGFEVTYAAPPGAVPWSGLRRWARPGHVVAMGLAVLQAVAALEAAGSAHGGLDAETVLVGPDGSVVLVGAGRSVGSDICAVRALLADELRAGDPPLASRIAAARRIETLAVALEDGPSPEPLADLFPGSAAVGVARSEAGESRSGRTDRVESPEPGLSRGRLATLGVVGAIGVALLVSGVHGLLATPTEAAIASRPASLAAPLPPVASPRASVPAPSPVPRDWRAVVGSLDARRTAALSSGSPDELATVDDPAGPSYARDLPVLRRLAGLSVRGGRTTLVSVREVTGAGDPVGAAVLEVVDRRDAYRLLGGTGRVRERVRARGELTWRVTLVPYDDTWRIWDATRRNA